MLSPAPARKPDEWYATEPIRGSGQNGHFTDRDFTTALAITRDQFIDIKKTCALILEKTADGPRVKLDLRSRWKSRLMQGTKSKMLDELLHKHDDVFNNTERFQMEPPNWQTARQTLAENLLIQANAARSRHIQRDDAKARASPPARSTTVDLQDDDTVLKYERHDSRNASPNLNILMLSNKISLDFVVVPVIHNGTRVIILPHQFRASQSDPTDPQNIHDVSLEKLAALLADELKTSHTPKIWGRVSFETFSELKNDQQLIGALILFIRADFERGKGVLHGLEVR